MDCISSEDRKSPLTEAETRQDSRFVAGKRVIAGPSVTNDRLRCMQSDGEEPKRMAGDVLLGHPEADDGHERERMPPCQQEGWRRPLARGELDERLSGSQFSSDEENVCGHEDGRQEEKREGARREHEERHMHVQPVKFDRHEFGEAQASRQVDNDAELGPCQKREEQGRAACSNRDMDVVVGDTAGQVDAVAGPTDAMNLGDGHERRRARADGHDAKIVGRCSPSAKNAHLVDGPDHVGSELGMSPDSRSGHVDVDAERRCRKNDRIGAAVENRGDCQDEAAGTRFAVADANGAEMESIQGVEYAEHEGGSQWASLPGEEPQGPQDELYQLCKVG